MQTANTTTAAENAESKPYSLRLPNDLKKWLRHEAVENSRSLHKEIVVRLQQSKDLQLQEQRQLAK